MKILPNLLSILRLALSLCLLLPLGTVPFYTLYLLGGASDVLDGYVARRFNAATRLGAKLDSACVLVFNGVVLYLLFVRLAIRPGWLIMAAVLTVTLVRLANALMTRVKFGQWGMLHTLGNKAAGLLLFLAAPVFWQLQATPAAIAVPLCILALFSALEETAILLTANTYEPNRKSFWTKPDN